MSRQQFLDYLSCKTEHYDFDGKVMMTGGAAPEFEVLWHPICERPLFHSGYDVFGVHWSRAKPASHYTQGQEPILSDIEKWREQVRFPKVERFDWDYVAEQAENLDRENKVSVVTLAIGPFERTTTLSAFDDALVNAISEPELYAELINRIADYKIEVIEYLHRYGKPDIINLHDDWGTAQNTFFNPELWREVIKPATERMYQAVRAGGSIVGQHSCGHVTPLLDDALAIGMQIWEAQTEANDIPALKEKYRGSLRILAPPPAQGDELGESGDEDEDSGPPVEALPKNYQPYSEKPTFLWE
ncbi:MAG: hypothetical protein LBP28_04295 [Coriobacteriales bacterium]|jgi:hypothetical protein|nr:hypothetical protein [Coriobacteriales bacterium]